MAKGCFGRSFLCLKNEALYAGQSGSLRQSGPTASNIDRGEYKHTAFGSQSDTPNNIGNANRPDQ
jgi:hypothetical protein